MSDIVLKLRAPHPNQRRLRDEARRFNVACMGRRFGKSVGGFDLLLAPVALNGYPTAWVAPKYKYLQEAWREANTLLKPVIARRDGNEHRLELITGGVIDFWSLEDPDAGRSRKYKRIIVDEAAMARHLERAWQQSLQATLMDYRGDAWFLSTPKGIVGPGAFFKELFDRGNPANPERDKNWMSWQLPTAANPYIHPDEIESMRLDMPELVYQQEVLAQFVDFAGTMVRREWLRYGQPPPLSELRVYMGVDLAISLKEEADYTAIVVLGFDSVGRVWVLHVERHKVTFLDTLDLIKRVAMRWRPLEIGVETVQYQAAVVEQLLRTTDLPVRPVRPDRDKLSRFQPLQVRYQQGLVWHADGLTTDWEEELLSFPLAEHDDMVDAAGHAYSLGGEFGRTQIIYPDQGRKEVVVRRIEEAMPGLPSNVTQIVAQRDEAQASGERCGSCEHFRAGRCLARGCWVDARDVGCEEFFGVLADVEEPAA